MTGPATSQHHPATHAAARQAGRPANHRPRAKQYTPANHYSPAPPRPEPRLRRLRQTPAMVKTGLTLIIALAVALGVLIATTTATVSGGFSRIGGTDGPLVEASTGLYFAVSDMDAQVANVLLTGDNPALAASRGHDLAAFATDRATADRELQRITAIAASDQAAQTAIATVIDVLGQYEALAADAMLVNERGHDLAGRPSVITRSYFEQATDLMTGRLLPAAEQLTRANAAALAASYARDRSAAEDGIAETAGMGAVLLAVLAGLQVLLARRFRRLLNPALALATLLTLGITIAVAAAFADQYAKLHVAKADAFDSVLALTEARATSYAANADESRYLVDPPRAARYQAQFLRQSLQIADVGNVGIGQYDTALAHQLSAYQADNRDVGFGGFLGTEFRNITFAGERASAEDALRAWQVYQRDDRRLRALAVTDLNAAIAFDTGTSPGQSDWAFTQYDSALSKVITINENAFADALAAGRDAGSGWNWPIPAAATAAIATLAIAGTRRRLAEYR